MSTVQHLEQAAIGSFVRQQRQKCRPEDFPTLVQRRRHVPHLTQADLAELAGVSEAAIAQIESSRYPNLNPNILSRICLALNLSPVHRHYLLNLLSDPGGYYAGDDDVPQRVRAVVDMAQPRPAVVVNASLDILYWNDAAAAVLADFAQMPSGDRNILKIMFCVPEARKLWVNWSSYVEDLVGGLKMQFSRVPDYRERISELVARMQVESEEFADLWKTVDPFLLPTVEKELDHPIAGRLRLDETVSEVVGAPYLFIIQFTPRDDQTATALQALAGE